jgi:hypothetical protein
MGGGWIQERKTRPRNQHVSEISDETNCLEVIVSIFCAVSKFGVCDRDLQLLINN